MSRYPTLLVLVLIPLLCGVTLSKCSLSEEDFTQVSENGFDPIDHAADRNDYPWSLVHFVPDGATEGHVYVGTGNGILSNVMAELGVGGLETPLLRLAEIRRYRPDLGPRVWEKVFDFHDIAAEQPLTHTGFRKMVVYRAQVDGVNYIYAASTMDGFPTVWRSATGEYGSWEHVWTFEEDASIRAMAVHHGLLYIGTFHNLTGLKTPGQIWATDGESFWPIIQDGFGNPANGAVVVLASFNNWLYAGTGNEYSGYEVWKLEGPNENGAKVQVVSSGGPDNRNQAAGTAVVFQDHLYIGSLTFGGFVTSGEIGFKGADLIRINADDTWDTVVGPESIGGLESGFGNSFNGYLWSMEVHDGTIYAGTYDGSWLFQAMADFPGLFPEAALSFLEIVQEEERPAKRAPTLLSGAFDIGADLYKSRDGVHWTPVTRTGFHDPYNYGVRNLLSVNDSLYVGMANPVDGLEVWQSIPLNR